PSAHRCGTFATDGTVAPDERCSVAVLRCRGSCVPATPNAYCVLVRLRVELAEVGRQRGWRRARELQRPLKKRTDQCELAFRQAGTVLRAGDELHLSCDDLCYDRVLDTYGLL